MIVGPQVRCMYTDDACSFCRAEPEPTTEGRLKEMLFIMEVEWTSTGVVGQR